MGTLLATIAVAVGAAVQGAIGIGFALVCAPFLVALSGPREGVKSAIALSIVLNLLMLLKERRDVLFKPILALLIPSLLALPVMVILVKSLDRRALEIAAGIVTIAGVAALATGFRTRRLKGAPAAAVAGVIGAAMNVVGGISGPPTVIYAINEGWPAKMMRPSLQFYFLVLNVAALFGLGLPKLSYWLPTGLAAGWIAGSAASGRVSESKLKAAMLIAAAVGGLTAIAKGII